MAVLFLCHQFILYQAFSVYESTLGFYGNCAVYSFNLIYFIM